jgi:hypothetical protein
MRITLDIPDHDLTDADMRVIEAQIRKAVKWSKVPANEEERLERYAELMATMERGKDRWKDLEPITDTEFFDRISKLPITGDRAKAQEELQRMRDEWD